MSVLIRVLFVISCAVFISANQANVTLKGSLESLITNVGCNAYFDVSRDYRNALYEFSIKFYKKIAERNDLNFVFSPLSIWLMLAGIAEGADPFTQWQLFNLLNLPVDPCVRQKYYNIANSRITAADDVKIINNRVLLVDNSVTLNPTWYDIVRKHSLLTVFTASIRYNPVGTANEIRWLMSASLPNLNMNGNSVLLDTMDYSGLWTNAFGDARVERATFYNLVGYPIGSVDMMRVKRRARMGYIKAIKAKVLEMPVGANGRYRMLFTVFLETDDARVAVQRVTKNHLLEMFESLRESYVPLEIAIPRIMLKSEIDVRALLEELGISSLWNNPAATRYISDPPAMPSSYVQRATLTLDNHGVSSSPFERDPWYGTPTGLDPIVGADFIANRPFMFGLFDTETLSCLIGTAYSTPTYT